MFQKFLLSIVLFCAFVVVAFFLVIKVIDFNEYKPKIHKAIKDSTGYEVMIKGDVALSLSPVGITVFDVELSNPDFKSETPFATLGSFAIALEIAPLFYKEIKVKYIQIDRLHVSIEKIKEGKFNFDLASNKGVENKKSKKTKETKESKDVNETVSNEIQFPLVNIKKVKFSEAHIVYVDQLLGTKILAQNIDIDISDINYDMAKQTKLQALSFNADTTIEKASYDGLTLNGFSANMHMKDANLVMENVTYTFLEAAFQGSGALDLSGKNPKVALKHKISNLKLSALTQAFWNKPFLEGDANGELKLAGTLSDVPTLKNTLNGFVHLDGKNVTLKGYDIDTIATSLKDPQNLNIVQLINGNFGIVEGGSSVLQHIVVHTDMGYSEVKLSDVALSSKKYRIAAKGALNIVEEKLLDVKLAILDAQGCASFEQTIVGSFKKPALKVDETTINTIANAALSLFGKHNKATAETPKDTVNCPPFYEGLVKHPEIK